MTKYIDVERLRAEINKIRHDWLDDSTGLEVGECGAWEHYKEEQK